MTENTIRELEAREDISVTFLNMDTSITEQITKNSDGSFSVFLNSRLNRDKHLMGYKHALQHILDGDFDNATDKNVQQIEATAHEASVPVSVPQENRDKKEELDAARKLDLEKLRKKNLRKLRRSRRKLAKEMTERDRFMQEVQKNNPEYFTRQIDRL